MQGEASADPARRDSGITLTPDQLKFCAGIGRGRHNSGSPSRQSDSGFSGLRVDLVGCMAEVAVCLFYGLDYEEQVTIHESRPGAIPDVKLGKWKVSVKGRERFDSPLDLVIGENDVHNHIYLLCSVNIETGFVLLRGYVTRPELMKYPLEEWKWTSDRPGAAKRGKRRRYVPVEDLRPCKKPSTSTAGPTVEAWADGSCNNVTGVGGWGVVLLEDGKPRAEYSGGTTGTTNNRMEIIAALQALRHAPEGSTVSLHSDSAYLVNSMQKGWVLNWRENGWRKGAGGRGGEVHNQDLWEVMLDTIKSRKLTVEWVKVKGHAGVVENERADELAGLEYRKLTDAAKATEPDPLSPLAEAIRTYLIRNPHNSMQPASWIMSTLWAHDLYPDRPDPVLAKRAMQELERRGLASNGNAIKQKEAV